MMRRTFSLLVLLVAPAQIHAAECNCVDNALGGGVFTGGDQIVALAWTAEGPNWVRIGATSGRVIDETPLPVGGDRNDDRLALDFVLQPPSLWARGSRIVALQNVDMCGLDLVIRDLTLDEWHAQTLELYPDCSAPDVAFGPNGEGYLLALFDPGPTEEDPNGLGLYEKAGGLATPWTLSALIEESACDSTVAVTVSNSGTVFGYCDGSVIDFDDPMMSPMPVGPVDVVAVDGAVADSGDAVFIVGTNEPTTVTLLRHNAGTWSEESVPLNVDGEIVQLKAGSATSIAVEIREEETILPNNRWDDPVVSVMFVDGAWRIEEAGVVSLSMFLQDGAELAVDAEAPRILASDGTTLELFWRDADAWETWRIAEVGFEGECPPCSEGCGCTAGDSVTLPLAFLVLAWRRMRGRFGGPPPPTE